MTCICTTLHNSAMRLDFGTQRLTRTEAARYLGVSIQFLDQDAVSGRHRIPYVRVGRKVYYLVNDLDAWLVSHRIIPGNCARDEHPPLPADGAPAEPRETDHE